MPGSIGPKGPAHVFKGMRMGGRMGGERVTATNLEVAAIDAAQNIIFVKGAVPGAINSFVMIKSDGELKVNLKSAKRETSAEEIKNEVPAAETPVSEVKTEVTEAVAPMEEIKEKTEEKVITEAGK